MAMPVMGANAVASGVAGEAPTPGGDGRVLPVHTFTQPGKPGGGEHLMPALFGVSVGALAGVGALAATAVGRPDLAPLTRGLVATGIGLGAAAATYGITWAIRGAAEQQPPLPSRWLVPTLPAPSPVGGIGDGLHPHGRQLGYARASWTTTERVCHGTGNDQQCHYERRHHSETSRLPVDVSTGRLDGYATLAELLVDHPGSSAVAVTLHDGRYYLHALDSSLGGHWSDVDSISVDFPNIFAIISPGGLMWQRERAGAPRFVQTDRVHTSVDPDRGIIGDSLAFFAQSRALDDVTARVDVRVSPRSGYTQLADALGDLIAREGSQVVVDHDGTLHVYDLDMHRPNPDRTVTGLRTTADATRAVALEFDGKTWLPVGSYWVTAGAAN